MSLEGCRFGGLERMAVSVVADLSKRQKPQKRQLASAGYGSRQYIGRKVCTPLPSESARGLAFLRDNAAACSAIGGRRLLFLAEKKKTRIMRVRGNRNGAPDRIRTYGFLLRRQTLYPLSYWGTSQSFIIR